MNRIEELFSKKKENILSIYFTAGFPKLNDTTMVLDELEKAGVDMVEIGIPFSDPLADGPVIQHSSEVALKNGMSLKLLFEQLEKSSIKRSKSAILLMGYINPVLQYGVENFCKKASECGVDGVILPDLPLSEYVNEYKSIFEKYGILNIFLITPQTAESRVRIIDERSKGFIYMVSSASTTGTNKGVNDAAQKYFQRIQNMKLKNPLMVGFGISDKESFDKACSNANGAIIGTAFIRAIEKSNDLKKDIGEFIKGISGESGVNIRN
jgi:tryptophan synthase alpha chain